MTLCLAQSLIDTQGVFIPQNAIRKYRDWYRNGYLSATGYCFDIGGATCRALTIWDKFLVKSRFDIDESDPEAHAPGQELVNKALAKEVRRKLVISLGVESPHTKLSSHSAAMVL